MLLSICLIRYTNCEKIADFKVISVSYDWWFDFSLGDFKPNADSKNDLTFPEGNSFLPKMCNVIK